MKIQPKITRVHENEEKTKWEEDERKSEYRKQAQLKLSSYFFSLFLDTVF